MDKYTELQMLAQRSAEERLSLANDLLFNEEDKDHPAYSVLAGPYCGCDTCVVREVLDAAWEFMREIAVVEVIADAAWALMQELDLTEETDEPG